MASKFTNRLVGTIALVALGVIILPDLLDGEKKRKSESFAVIPIKPDVSEPNKQSTAQLEKLLSRDVARAEESNDTEGQDDTHKAAQAVAKTDASDSELKPVKVDAPASLSGFKNNAWVIQLGGFKNAANANTLVQKLRDAGFTTYTKPKKPVQGRITRVYVGPNLNKDTLERQLVKLKRLTGLKGEIYAYNPVDS